ncbi:MAG: hypothetical protein J5772_03855 [Clostridia bacterium]|nr:hypothetical protein [Clostridia bacterium]
MKKIMSAIIITIMALSVFVGAAARPECESGYTGDALNDAEIILYLPAGESENEIGYKTEYDWRSGPEAFIVDGNKVAVLDSVKCRIVVYNGKSLHYIPLSECTRPRFMCRYEELYYLIDYDETTIYAISDSGELCGTISIPEGLEFSDIFSLRNQNGILQLLTIDCRCYSLNSLKEWELSYNAEVTDSFSPKKVFSVLGNTVSVNTGDNTLAQYLAESEDCILIGVYEFVPFVPIIETEYTIRKYDFEGDLIGCTVIDYRNAFSIPQTAAFISDNDTIYTMLCREEGVYITRPNLQKQYDSHIQDLEDFAYKIMPSSMRALNTRTVYTQTSLTRNQVKQRANDAKNHLWTLTSNNMSTPPGVILPHFIQGVTPPRNFIGIPYCWGNEYFANLDDFDDDLDNGLTAGNISYTKNLQTTGMDCSGFVSYAYLLGTHKKTKKLKEDVGYFIYGNMNDSTVVNDASFANMEEMDYLVAYDVPGQTNHAILYYSRSNAIVTIYESTRKSNIDKTTKRTVNISSINGYYLKTVYACGGQWSCVYTNHYGYNSSQHWITCDKGCGSVGGGYGQHTWYTAIGGDSICVVCGYTQSGS